MQSPGVNPFNMEESLQEIERQVEIAITSVKKMEKYDGIWHPNAKKGVSLPFTDAVVIALHAILGTARQIRSNIEETQKEKDAVIINPSDLQFALDNNKVTFVE